MFTFRLARGLFYVYSICIIVGLGCGDDDNGTGPSVPRGPSHPFPEQGALDVPVVSSFSWTYSDSLAGRLQYDLYLGITNPPPIYRTRLTDTTVVVGPLDMNKNYYWKVIAYDLTGDSVSSCTWSFRSASTFEFPATVGNVWDYFYSYVETYYSKAGIKAVDTTTGGCNVNVAGIDTLSDTVETVRFHTSWAIGGNEGTVEDYRLIRNDGMYLYAYDNPWQGPPKIAAPDAVYYEFKGMRFNSIEELVWTIRTGYGHLQKSLNPALVIENPPIKELVYPLEIDRQWLYRDTDVGHVFDIQKKIIGIETVTVPIGVFECFVVRWSWDTDNDGVWDSDIEAYDYISGAGTVKRVYRFLGVTIVDYTGSVLGTADIEETFGLLGYQLHADPAEL